MMTSDNSGKIRAKAPKPPARNRIFTPGLMLLCLLAFSLAGCSVKVPVPYPVKTEIPAELIRPLHWPDWKGKTNLDLLEYAQDLEEVLLRADADRTALRALADQETTEGKVLGKIE